MKLYNMFEVIKIPWLNDADHVNLLLGNDDTKAININAKR